MIGFVVGFCIVLVCKMVFNWVVVSFNFSFLIVFWFSVRKRL